PLFVLVAALPLLLRWAGLPPDLIRLPIIDSLAVYGRQIALIDPGHGMLWTVRVEIVFYGVFVAIWLLHRAIGHRWITALLLTVAAVAMEIDQTSFWFSPLNYLRHFLYGVILALLHRPGNHPRVANGLAMLALATLPLTVPMVWRHWTGHAVTAWQNPLVSLQMLLLLNGLLHPRGGLVPLFAAAPMRWMGQISYSTYLLHPFILTLLKGVLGRDTHPALVFPLFLLLTLALAQITYQRFELPMRRYFQRFQQAATTKPPDSA
ncbi:MAG: hypothetical protein RLZZ501_831, partial [Pseudomonadota bacterium]